MDNIHSEFETWARSETPMMHVFSFTRTWDHPHGERYLELATELAFRAYKAAKMLSQAQQESHDELTLRRLLCMVYSGNNAYTDDGELQDNAAQPFIDFKRDSAWELQKKLHARVVNSLTKLPPATEGEKPSLRPHQTEQWKAVQFSTTQAPEGE